MPLSGPHILDQATYLSPYLFSNIFNLRCVTLVVIHFSQLNVSISRIIDVYSIISVRFVNNSDFKNINMVKNALCFCYSRHNFSGPIIFRIY
jgi:hypothetical protein